MSIVLNGVTLSPSLLWEDKDGYSQVAQTVKAYCDAGLRVPKILDYGGMAGLAYGADSARKVREAEDELMRLTGGN